MPWALPLIYDWWDAHHCLPCSLVLFNLWTFQWGPMDWNGRRGRAGWCWKNCDVMSSMKKITRLACTGDPGRSQELLSWKTAFQFKLLSRDRRSTRAQGEGTELEGGKSGTLSEGEGQICWRRTSPCLDLSKGSPMAKRYITTDVI